MGIRKPFAHRARSSVDAAGGTVESVHVVAERETVLAGTPGFHSLSRAMLHGLAGPGSAILAVFCSCDDDEYVARVTLRLSPKEETDFQFVERGRGRIEVSPALDLRTLSGHFLTDQTWTVAPEGWSQIGPVVKAKLAKRKTAIAPPRARAAAEDVSGECVCGHAIEFHNPCSVCECPAYAAQKKGAPLKRYKRRA